MPPHLTPPLLRLMSFIVSGGHPLTAETGGRPYRSREQIPAGALREWEGSVLYICTNVHEHVYIWNRAGNVCQLLCILERLAVCMQTHYGVYLYMCMYMYA